MNEVTGRRVLLPARLAHRLGEWPATAEVAARLVVLPDDEPGNLPWREVTGAVLWSWTPAELAVLLLDRCPRLAWLHSTWAGVDHLPLERITTQGVALTNARGIDAGPLAEWVVAVLLARLKALPRAAEQQRCGVWQVVDGDELTGKRVLVVGTGTIGRAVATRLAPFGVHLAGVRRRPRRLRPFRRVYGPAELPRAAAHCDVLVCALPLTPDTNNMVGAEVLDALPTGAAVVNVGRGETLDLEALRPHLAAGRLWAALDVFPTEPLPPDSPLWSCPNLVISPHSAHATPRHRARHLALVRDQLRRYLGGRPLRNLVT